MGLKTNDKGGKQNMGGGSNQISWCLINAKVEDEGGGDWLGVGRVHAVTFKVQRTSLFLFSITSFVRSPEMS